MGVLISLLLYLMIFFLKVTEETIRWSLRRPNFELLSPRKRVLKLEQIRQYRGYKPGWLWHRCKEENLIEAYEELVLAGEIPGAPNRPMSRSSSGQTYLREQTPEERVLTLEAIRIKKGYKPGWLFYQCRDEGLLGPYQQLLSQERIEGSND